MTVKHVQTVSIRLDIAYDSTASRNPPAGRSWNYTLPQTER